MTEITQWVTLEQGIATLQTCSHPHNDITAKAFLPIKGINWCNLCGAININRQWIQPHWRDLLLKVLK